MGELTSVKYNKILLSYAELRKVFGSRLASIRKNRGWTQEVLASKFGTTQETIAIWEGNKQLPSRKNVDKLCKLLHIDRFFFERVESNVLK